MGTIPILARSLTGIIGHSRQEPVDGGEDVDGLAANLDVML